MAKTSFYGRYLAILTFYWQLKIFFSNTIATKKVKTCVEASSGSANSNFFES